MIDGDLATVLLAIEAQTALLESVCDGIKELGARDIELADNIIDLERRLVFIAGRSRTLMAMKAVTRTTTCLRCRCEFANEPGPALCGPCWTELGRPERYLEPVPPMGA